MPDGLTPLVRAISCRMARNFTPRRASTKSQDFSDLVLAPETPLISGSPAQDAELKGPRFTEEQIIVSGALRPFWRLGRISGGSVAPIARA
jgi:hypothetical protein